MEMAILVITCLMNLALGSFIVYQKKLKSGFVRSFVAMSVMICVWTISNYITDYNSENLTLLNSANRIAYASGYAVIFSGLIFTYYFPVKRIFKTYEILIFTIISLIVGLLSLTSLIAGDVSLDITGHQVFTFGTLISLYIASIISLLYFIIRNLLSVITNHSRNHKIIAQARIVLVAFITSAVVGMVLNVVMPSLTDSWYTAQFGPLSTIILVGLIVYAIIKHGMFDIKYAVIRTAGYLLSLSTLALIYYGLAYLLSLAIYQGELQTSVSLSPINIGLALLLAFIFQPIKKFFDRVTNSIFYKSSYNTDDFFAKLNKTLTYTTDLKALLKRSSVEIGDTLKSDQVFFVVNTTNGHFVTAGTNNHTQMPKVDIVELTEYQKNKDGLIIASLMESGNHIRRMMISHKVELVLPLKQDGNILGYLCLGVHRNSGYTTRDMKVLTTISDELAIAIQNALSIQEVKNLNENLQQRISQATQELRESNAQLQRLDKAKDEFVSIASHQLRTPLTSVKGYISMVLEGDVGKITYTQRKLLVEAFSSSERMVHLINDFLNVSRLQTGKFLIEKTAVNLDEIIKQELKSLDSTAKSRGLSFIYKSPKKAVPDLYLDESKIRQVIMNYADNAIFYSPENTKINVSLGIKGDTVRFIVKDNGMGVPSAERSQLFTKFYRASNARRQRPDGTGVGLFLAKKVIDAHDGKIVFESVEGKGSTFGFELSASANKLPDSAK